MAEINRSHIVMLAAVYFAGLGSAVWIDWPLALVVATSLFSATYLVLAINNRDELDGKSLRLTARKTNVPAYVIFAITVGAAASALVALFLILNADEKVSRAWLALALLAIPLGWATIHMMAAFHYAYLYWRSSGAARAKRPLEFPGEADPDGWDFVYFAFVIGMAAQTADVAIRGKSARRFALAHSIIAYFFNTVLIASAVNVAVAN